MEQPREVVEQNIITAEITGFNSVPWQTDNTPCIAAGGYICDKVQQVAACPRHIPLYTWIEIDGRKYQCYDRLAPKYDNRFDIYFGMDVQAALTWGRQIKQVTILG